MFSLCVNLIEALTETLVLTGIIVASLGLGVVMLARPVTKSVRQTKKIKNTDTIYVSMKIFGLVMLLVAMIIMVIYALGEI